MTYELTPLAKEEIYTCSLMVTSGKLRTIERYVLTEYIKSLLRGSERDE